MPDAPYATGLIFVREDHLANVRAGRLRMPYRPEQRYWAVGVPPARLAHRVVGEWPGNAAVVTACGSSICLHGEAGRPEWNGGYSYCFDEIPSRYSICLKCVAEDETVE